MATIIRQLLDFARRRGPQRARDDLTAIVRQTLALLRTIAHKQNVTLELTTDQPVEAEVEAGQVQQALTNLVVNAIQASPRGGRVTAELGHRRATPPADEAGAAVPPASYAFVSVRDEGPGIAAEIREHVFEPFFTTKGVGEGTGLGLSVAWGIIHDHGGFIAVDGGVGRGATFTIYLPSGGAEVT